MSVCDMIDGGDYSYNKRGRWDTGVKSVAIRPYDKKAYEALLNGGMTPVMARIYAARGIQSPADISHDLSMLLPFSQLKNCEAMAIRLADAIADKKRFLVVADYDVDGATSCAVAMEGLSKLGGHVEFIVPNRFECGYGLTPQIVDWATEHRPDIIITVDNGTSSMAGVAHANQLGIEVLITDHHLPSNTLPDALIVNPNQPGCDFPSKHLAGVGVIFYVLLALRAQMRLRGAFLTKSEPNMADLLDWVAMGTVADVARLDHNNRILVEQGLRRIRAGRMHHGTRGLFKRAKRDPKKATARDLSHAIGPRLNAAGRMDDMTVGIHCLMATDEFIAHELAAKLEQFNGDRRTTEIGMQETALMQIDQLAVGENYTLVLHHQDWHQGLIGIIASRLKDRFYRPTIVFAPSTSTEGEWRGSGRSISGFHLCDALAQIHAQKPHIMNRFGGHAMAAGVNLDESALTEFKKEFERVARERLDPNLLTHHYDTDGHLANTDISFDTAKQLSFQVWGQGFEAPLFYDYFSVVAQQVVAEKHLKIRLEKEGMPLDAMLFGFNDVLPKAIYAVYQLVLNEWCGRQSVQIYIRHWFEKDLLSTTN